jgi:hypothetical protein
VPTYVNSRFPRPAAGLTATPSPYEFHGYKESGFPRCSGVAFAFASTFEDSKQNDKSIIE